MAEFKEYAPKLRRIEGGFVNHPQDEGGPTYMGVTLDTFKSIYGQDKTIQDLKAMDPDKCWDAIMKTNYWDKCNADLIDNQSVAEILVDWCVNSGMVGLRKVQELVGARPDGIAGPITLSLINTANQEVLFSRIKAARQQFYINIVNKSPSKKVFMNGWTNRLAQFKFEA